MAGELHQVMDELQRIIDTAQMALDRLSEIANPVELDEGPAEFPAPGGEFEVDETSVSIQAVPEPGELAYAENVRGLLVEYCPNTEMHDPHEWGYGPQFCPGMPF